MECAKCTKLDQGIAMVKARIARAEDRIRHLQTKVTEVNRQCSVCGTEEKVIYCGKYKGLLCMRHYHQFWTYGRFNENGIVDRSNDVMLKGDVVEITMRNKKGFELGKAIVSARHYDLVKGKNWLYHSADKIAYYLEKNVPRRLTNCIFELGTGGRVEWLNGDRLDCRDENVKILRQGCKVDVR